MAELGELEIRLNKLTTERENDQKTIEGLREELKSLKRETDPPNQVYEVLQDKKRSPAEELLIHDVEKAAKAAIHARIKLITGVLGIPGLVIGLSILLTASDSVKNSILTGVQSEVDTKVTAQKKQIEEDTASLYKSIAKKTAELESIEKEVKRMKAGVSAIIKQEIENLKKTEKAVKEANEQQLTARKGILKLMVDANVSVAKLNAKTNVLDEFIAWNKSKTTLELDSIKALRETARKDLEFLNSKKKEITDLIAELDKEGIDANKLKNALVLKLTDF